MKTVIISLFMILPNITFGQIPNELSKEEKIFGLSKFWQEINYNYIYFNKINQAEWDTLYKEYIIQVQETKNDYEYYRLLQKFCAYLKDGHTNVWFPEKIQDSVFNGSFGSYRLFLKNIEDKAIITRVNLSKKDEIPIGTEIISVNGINTQEYIKDCVIPYISSSTDYVRQDLGVFKMLEGYAGTKYDLKLKLPDGSQKSLTVYTSKTKEKEVYPPVEKKELLSIKWLENDIAHVSLNSFMKWEISSSFVEKIPELKKAKKLIIDLRKNGGGHSRIGKVILHHLTNDTIFYGSKTQSRLHIPTLKAWKQDTYYHDFPYKPDTLGIGDRNLLKTSRIVVPTAILIGHRTASAAEDFLIYADKQKHMIKIGAPTNGSTGQPLFFDLPNGGIARVCTKKDTYPDGREFVGFGIQPDIKVEKMLSDYIENKDPVLEKAIQYLNSKK
ncbi:S41 family peptidase [Aquimarina litoralis]|uniref:S41 family peptidase n=1 Tax=Aquimarina litoralis TaxID=584605 RepID=UPI001C55B898|nr:S41 family peptidase [Aquimarina litoralis]MBW1294751.1 peptidase S41 [Aquimarina litoralis]